MALDIKDTRYFTAHRALVCDDASSSARVMASPIIEVDATGYIVAIGQAPPPAGSVLHDLGHSLLLPAMVNGHSHAFQRGIRGQTHRRGAGDPSSFWSWRTAMYAKANAHTPDTFYQATRACYEEMLAAGISHVGEFHYVHHQVDGRPYDDANELSKAVIAAAASVGMGLTLLEVFYQRAGAGSAALPEQRRFCDANIDAYLARVDDLRSFVQNTEVKIGLAPHSIRAVGASDLQQLAAYAARHELVVHAHVSEQVRENEECWLEHGCTPMQAFERAGLLQRARSFTAVHAIHTRPEDLQLLANQHVCACPTTEADLGDGVLLASQLLAVGTRVSLGSDSNSVIDLVQEARCLEMHERLAKQARLCLNDASGQLASVLLAAATTSGASSLGLRDVGELRVGMRFDVATFDLDHRHFASFDDESALDCLLLAGTASSCSQVWRAGELAWAGE